MENLDRDFNSVEDLALVKMIFEKEFGKGTLKATIAFNCFCEKMGIKFNG